MEQNTDKQEKPQAVELNPQQALSVLIQAVNFAQSKGVYTLEDAELISKAVKTFVKNDKDKDKPKMAVVENTETTESTVTNEQEKVEA